MGEQRLAERVGLPPSFIALGHYTCLADREVLAELVRAIAAQQVVEVGTWTGMSTLALAQPGVRVFCVDTWQGQPEASESGQPTGSLDHIHEIIRQQGYTAEQIYQAFKQNMGQRLFDTVVPMQGSSQEMCHHFVTNDIDLVYLDADHRYQQVRQQIADWWPRVKVGGILAGHDIGWDGVRQAVEDTLGPYRSQGNVWWIPKENTDGRRLQSDGGAVPARSL